MNLTFIETPAFTRRLEDLFTDEDNYYLLQNALLENPERGDIIPGTGGLRKTRWSDPRRGKGTRGGIRVIYILIPEYQTVVFLQAYNKDRQNDMTAEQKKLFATLAQIVRKEIVEP
jgi:mRNA-degrading endonuclease RelE of RelBE toxin-antitoxin system